MPPTRGDLAIEAARALRLFIACRRVTCQERDVDRYGRMPRQIIECSLFWFTSACPQVRAIRMGVPFAGH